MKAAKIGLLKPIDISLRQTPTDGPRNSLLL